MSGKFGVKGGNMRAQNLQGGIVTIATNASGNGSGSTTFRQSMKGLPVITGLNFNMTSAELSTGVLTATNRTHSGFKVNVRGASKTSGVVYIGYIAFDDNYR